MNQEDFFSLTPDRVMSAAEASGLRVTGRCMALNSFENRVYELELDQDLEPGQPLHLRRRVAKFYRPGRWTREQILEEHQFIADLVEAEIPAVAPIAFSDGATVHQDSESGIYYALFPKVGGRSPDELNSDQLRWLGRLIARMHAVGAAREAPHRVLLSPQTYGRANLEFLLAGDWIPLEFRRRYEETVRGIVEKTTPLFLQFQDQLHRLHGDCHLGNLLWNQDGPFFLDFDDMVRGPSVQDVWLLIPDRGPDGRAKLEMLLEGYEEMRPFDRTQLRLIEPLRALRYVHYTAWIARRWEDPSFPRAFPQFGTHRYWNDEAADLEQQLRLITEREHAS